MQNLLGEWCLLNVVVLFDVGAFEQNFVEELGVALYQSVADVFDFLRQHVCSLLAFGLAEGTSLHSQIADSSDSEDVSSEYFIITYCCSLSLNYTIHRRLSCFH